MIRLDSRCLVLPGLMLVALVSLLASQPATAANYYIGSDAACGGDRITVALLAAALSGDPNPVFHISKSKPDETAEIVVAYGALQTAEFRGGYNSCQDAINGVAPSGRSTIRSNALATSANRRVMRIGSASNSPVVRFYDVTISGGRLDSTVIPVGYGAGVFVEFGTVQMFRTWVEGNWTNPANTQSRGGGVAVRGSGRFLSIDEGTVIRDNDAYDGGGIYCANNAVFLMEGSDVRDNRGIRGGGLHVTSGCNAPLTSTSASSGQVRNNSQASGSVALGGGGIYVGTNSLVTLIGTPARRFLVTGNNHWVGGGVAVAGDNAALSSNWTTFNGNTGNAYGGAIACFTTGSDESVSGQNIQITNNVAGLARGGALYANGCRARFFNGVLISGNAAGAGASSGGGIAAYSAGEESLVTIQGGSQPARIVNNSTSHESLGTGGGVAAWAESGGSARVVLENVEVSGNQATGWGGGLDAMGTGAEIIMRRTLAGSACHSEFYCSDLSFNTIDSANSARGAAAAARDGGRIEITGTYIEGNVGTAIRGDNLSSSNSGIIRLFSNVLVTSSNYRGLHGTQAGVEMQWNTIDHVASSVSPVRLQDNNNSNRRSFFYGNLFNGSTAPVLSPEPDWFVIGHNGCAGFSQIHPGNNFFSAHAAARRYVGNIPLQPGTRLINDPTHPIIDYCDQDLASNPGIDILGNSRPFNTPNPNTHGTFDLGAHEIRTPPFYTLDASRAGQGSLASSPAGIDCPGTCNASFVEGTSVQMTAAPDSGWAFSHWDGNCSGSNPVCNIVMSANRVVVARFVQQFNLNVFLVGDGSVNIQPDDITCTSNCTEVFNDGTVLTLTATPEPGFLFNGWTGVCTGTGTCNVTMSQNRSVAAEFIEQPTGDVIFQDRFEP